MNLRRIRLSSVLEEEISFLSKTVGRVLRKNSSGDILEIDNIRLIIGGHDLDSSNGGRNARGFLALVIDKEQLVGRICSLLAATRGLSSIRCILSHGGISCLRSLHCFSLSCHFSGS